MIAKDMFFKTNSQSRIAQSNWDQPFDRLRQKWCEIPAGNSRMMTGQLLNLSDKELLQLWESVRTAETTGEAFELRGWYHTIYKDLFRGKRIMDFGSGFGIDGLTFAQNGAQMTLVDIVESNLGVVQRLCKLLGLNNVDFFFMQDLDSLSKLGTDYDAIWCVGSLINAPFDVIRAEAQELLRHLKPDGRWIELAYPETRWAREGRLPFDQWGERTDGSGTPWVEWYDLAKLRAALDPVEFEVVLHFEFHQGEFNWFDLKRK